MAGEAKGTALLTVGWLQAQFGRDLARARQTFRAFVQDAPRPRPP
jgi:hypothetical protein